MTPSKTSSLLIILVLLTITGISSASNHADRLGAEGKKATITLSTSHKFGGFTLKLGDYQFQHHVNDGGDHFMYFTVLKGRRHATLGGVRCQVEPLPAIANETSVTTTSEAGVGRITRIVIRGENVAHVFSTSVAKNTSEAEQTDKLHNR
jgi:hypothetical protein